MTTLMLSNENLIDPKRKGAVCRYVNGFLLKERLWNQVDGEVMSGISDFFLSTSSQGQGIEKSADGTILVRGKTDLDIIGYNEVTEN